MRLNKYIKAVATCSVLAFVAQCNSSPQSSLEINAKAPDFTLPDSTGGQTKLAEYVGKTVVLEWTNHECPFVVKHYESKNMQSLQKKYTQSDIVWLTIISSAQDKQGYVTPEQANQLTSQRQASPTKVLFDKDGTVGKKYGAQTTPHMYIINPEGNLVYQGAIDSIRSTKIEDIAKATNYVEQALTELKNNQPVSVPVTTAYGCSIKYQ